MKSLVGLASLICLNALAVTAPPQYGVEGLYSGTLDCPGAHSAQECAEAAGEVKIAILETRGASGLLVTVHTRTGQPGGAYRFHRSSITRGGTAVEGSTEWGGIAELFAYVNPDTGEMEATIRDAAIAADLRIVARRQHSPRDLFPPVPGESQLSGTDLVGEYKMIAPRSPARFVFNVSLGGTPAYVASFQPKSEPPVAFSAAYNRDFEMLELITPASAGFPEKWFLRAASGHLWGVGISSKTGYWQTISLQRRWP